MMKKIIILVILVVAVFLVNKAYENMEISNMQVYQKDYDKFSKLNHEVTGFYMLDGDYYAVMQNYYKQTKEYKSSNSVFLKNRKLYMKHMQKLLPHYENIEKFFAFDFIEDKNRVVTNAYYKKFKFIIEELKIAKKLQVPLNKVPVLFFVLNGGSGKKIPFDVYEKSIKNAN